MDLYKLDDFIGGWIIGNFDPAILKTEHVEVCLKMNKKGEYIEPHYQEISTEYNIVVNGRMMVNGHELTRGDVFVYNPGEVCYVEILEDSDVVVVKTPSLGDSDKVVV